MPPVKSSIPRKRSSLYPFRRAVLRGLGVLLPPLLTIVIFLWVGGTIQQYALTPVTTGVRNVVAWSLMERDRRQAEGDLISPARADRATGDATNVRVKLTHDVSVPLGVYQTVNSDDPVNVLASGDRRAIFRRFVEIEYLRPQRVVPLFLCVFVLLLYLLGKFLAAGIGRVFWNLFEWGIHRLPLVRNVYSAVKQVTDFMLNESELEYTRVVAVEYPRKGIWALGFVTGESLLDIRAAANEPVLSIMIPSSPMSVTGYTITVLKSETIDLNLTMDQALQFVISCGVVVPAHQLASKHDELETAT